MSFIMQNSYLFIIILKCSKESMSGIGCASTIIVRHYKGEEAISSK